MTLSLYNKLRAKASRFGLSFYDRRRLPPPQKSNYSSKCFALLLKRLIRSFVQSNKLFLAQYNAENGVAYPETKSGAYRFGVNQKQLIFVRVTIIIVLAALPV
jgi:hypothetical protein